VNLRSALDLPHGANRGVSGTETELLDHSPQSERFRDLEPDLRPVAASHGVSSCGWRRLHCRLAGEQPARTPPPALKLHGRHLPSGPVRHADVHCTGAAAPLVDYDPCRRAAAIEPDLAHDALSVCAVGARTHLDVVDAA